MSGTTTRARLARHTVHPRPRRLGRGWRNATLVIHIVSAGAWIGVDVIVGVLVFTGWFGDQTELRSLAYQALASFVVWPMLAAGLVCLASGLVLGLGTKWGLVRYWWVAVKLVLNVVLCTLIVLLLQPGMGEVAEYGRDLLTDSAKPAAVSRLFFPPAVSLTALSLATVLAVFKPWGRIRARRSPDDAPSVSADHKQALSRTGQRHEDRHLRSRLRGRIHRHLNSEGSAPHAT